MKQTSWVTLAMLALVLGIAGFVVGRMTISFSGGPLPVPFTAGFLLLAIALAVLVTAWPVRKFARGERLASFSPLRAARAVVLAKAASHCGAMLAGWYIGNALVVVADLGIPALRSNFLWQAGTAVVALVVVGVGLLGESWCRRPDDEDDPGHDRLGGETPDPA